MLKDDEFKNWLIQAQQGNEQAREVLVKENLNLVRSIAHRFQNRGYEWDDLFQIGCIGLIKAIERFDLQFETKFSTYAVPMILGEIRRFIRDDHPIKVSRSLKELAYQVHNVQEKLQAVKGCEPSVAEIAADMQMNAAEVAAALAAIQPAISLFDQTFVQESKQPVLLEQLKTPEDEESQLVERLTLEEVIKSLPDKERQIIELRFFSDRRQADIAEFLALSQVQVSRLEKKALQFIRKNLKNS